MKPTVVVYKRLMSVSDHLGTNRLLINSRLVDLDYCIHLIVSMLGRMDSEIDHQLARLSQGLVGVAGSIKIREYKQQGGYLEMLAVR